MGHNKRKSIAIIGAGISGLSAAWLLSRAHSVVVYEAANRIGGHSNTVTLAGTNLAVDTGFIVYNELTYPNLTALFRHLAIPTCGSEMSFAVSLGSGGLEYSGSSLGGLFAQKSNLMRPRFLRMLCDIVRFYSFCPAVLATLDDETTLGELLDANGYGAALKDDHLLPMAGAIWSAEPSQLLHYPARAFVEFFLNHQLFNFTNRVNWRTVAGGSRVYVEAIVRDFSQAIRLNAQISHIERRSDGVWIHDGRHGKELFDEVILATHADQALTLLGDAAPEERRLLGSFRYSRNIAMLHRDPALMPRRRKVWSSWNFLSDGTAPGNPPCVTYWMNRLQRLDTDEQVFVTLNPIQPPRDVLHEEVYDHPIFDRQALRAQESLWSLQGHRRTWYCGAYFGAGFHEDGLQAGLAVAEMLGGQKRPWEVKNESGRIKLGPGMTTPHPLAA